MVTLKVISENLHCSKLMATASVATDLKTCNMSETCVHCRNLDRRGKTIMVDELRKAEEWAQEVLKQEDFRNESVDNEEDEV